MKSRTRNRMRRKALLAGILTLALTAVGMGPASAADTIRFGDASWDSIQVHNRIAGFILKHGYGYDVDYLPGETAPLVTGLMRGDVDVYMESWTENIQDMYDKGIKDGSIIDLGSNYPDSWQGWLVPSYVVKGDAERGIEPMAPDLKSVRDLPKHWELFKDPENPSKGRFYNSIPGWKVTSINEQKIKAYGLEETYNVFLPGSDAALSGSMVAAYEKGEPWLGYYWAPTWVLGKLDMTPLKEPPYDEKVWESTKACAFPSVQVNILVHSDLPGRAPEAVGFFKKYETTTAVNNKVLAYMQEEKADTEEAARWFLENYRDLWISWVSEEAAGKVLAALK